MYWISIHSCKASWEGQNDQAVHRMNLCVNYCTDCAIYRFGSKGDYKLCIERDVDFFESILEVEPLPELAEHLTSSVS